MSLTKIELDELTDETLFDNTDQAVEASAVNTLIKEVTNSAHLKSTGTDGRVFFQKAGELGQNANFFWNDTTERLSLGMGSSPTAILDIRSAGGLSTDLAFRIRNHTNTGTLFEARGDGSALFTTSNVASVLISKGANDAPLINSYTAGKLSSAIGTGYNITDLYFGNINLLDWNQVVRTKITAMGTSFLNGRLARFAIGGNQLALDASSNVFGIFNGVVPTSNVVDGFQQYSADIVPGNAASHFRTENGAIIKLYQETPMVGSATTPGGIGTPITDDQTFDGYTVAQAIKALRNLGFLA